MTICLYNNKTLYSDRAGVLFSKPAIFLEINKLFIDTSGCFAFVVSGPSFTKNNYFNFSMNILRKLLKQADVFEANINIKEELKDFFKDRNLIIVTRNRAYRSDKESLIPLDLSAPCSLGTGNIFATIALQAGKTDLEAMKIASLTDVCSYLTEIDSIKMEDLKPF